VTTRLIYGGVTFSNVVGYCVNKSGSHTIADNITESDSSLNKSGSHAIADNITESDSSLNKSGSHTIADNITESDSFI
jgi:ubiquinone biosynthesis protein UbiJ